VNKNVLAAIVRSDKAKALGFVKPFNGSCCHNNYLSKNVNNLNVAGTTNSRRLYGAINQVLDSQTIAQLYPHVIGSDDEYYVERDLSEVEMSDLESKILASAEFDRITDSGRCNLEDLDVFNAHGPIGTTRYANRIGSSTEPYSIIAAYLSNNAKLTIEGDKHEYFRGENAFGNYMVRPGEKMIDVYKDDSGVIQISAIDFSSEFDSFEGYKVKDRDEFKAKIEHVYSIMRQNYEAQVQSDEFLKAA